MTTSLRSVLLAACLAIGAGAAAAFSCPSVPDEVAGAGPDVNAYFSARMGELAPLGADEIAAQAELVARALFAKYPSLDKLVTLQTMSALYCSRLVRTSLPEVERDQRWSRFEERIMALMARPAAASSAPVTRALKLPAERELLERAAPRAEQRERRFMSAPPEPRVIERAERGERKLSAAMESPPAIERAPRPVVAPAERTRAASPPPVAPAAAAVPAVVPDPVAAPAPVPAATPEVAPAAAPAPPDAFAAIDQALANLASANIAFNKPVSVNLKSTAEIELLLSLKKTVAELSGELVAAGVRHGEAVKVSSQMEARLSGPNFQITAITPEQQAVGSVETVRWQWEVKPLATGRHKLHLTLSAIFNANGSTTRKSIRTFDEEIEVKVTPAQVVTDFIAKNWQWLWAVVVLPVGAWAWKRWSARRNAST